MLRPLVLIACVTAATVLTAQNAALDAVLARFPNDELPSLLSGLHGAKHGESVHRLASMGARAHPFLFGLARLPRLGPSVDFSAAFAGFGPQSTWALPGLMEAASSGRLGATQRGLFRMLGGAARPALPLLQGLLAEQEWVGKIETLAELASAYEPVPTPAAVDARWQQPLLDVLADPAQQHRWWPALQALQTMDVEAHVLACERLLPFCGEPDVERQRRAELLLHALRCHHAATAMLDLAVAASVPGPVGEQQMLSSVLASWPCLLPALRARSAWPDSCVPPAIAASEQPSHQRLSALAAALHAAANPVVVQDAERLSALARGADPQVALFAYLALHRSRVESLRWIGSPLTEVTDEQLTRLQAIDDESARSLPLAWMQKALQLAAPGEPRVVVKQPSSAQDLSASILDAARHPPDVVRQVHASEPIQFVRLLARKKPELVLEGDWMPDECTTLVQALLPSPPAPVPALLHGWLIDNLPIDNDGKDFTPRQSLPIEVAPAMAISLRDPKRAMRAVFLLYVHRHLLQWAKFRDEQAEQLAALMPSVTAELDEPFSELFVFGHACARVRERMLLDAQLPGALRKLLARRMPDGERFPPSSEFVVAALTSADELLVNAGLSASGYVLDHKEQVFELLRGRLPTGAVRSDLWTWMAIARLRCEEARPWLEQRLASAEQIEVFTAGLALLELDAEHKAAAQAMLGVLDAVGEGDLRARLWQLVSQADGASAALLEAAVPRLADQQDTQLHHRLTRVLERAAKRRPAAAEAALVELTGHMNKGIAQMATSAIEELRRVR